MNSGRLTYIVTLAAIISLVVGGCGGPVHIEGNIVNGTSESFNVAYNQTTSVLAPNSVLKISYLTVINSTNRNRERKNFDCCPCKLSSEFSIKPVNTGKKLVKDYYNRSSWTIRREGKEVSCDFEIFPGDVQ
jgi:hypothetical protein